jgi:hypothetical protein
MLYTKHPEERRLRNRAIPGALRTTARLRPALRGYAGHLRTESAHKAGRRASRSKLEELGGE